MCNFGTFHYINSNSLKSLCILSGWCVTYTHPSYQMSQSSELSMCCYGYWLNSHDICLSLTFQMPCLLEFIAKFCPLFSLSYCPSLFSSLPRCLWSVIGHSINYEQVSEPELLEAHAEQLQKITIIKWPEKVYYFPCSGHSDPGYRY